jgi:hypothetical protein
MNSAELVMKLFLLVFTITVMVGLALSMLKRYSFTKRQQIAIKAGTIAGAVLVLLGMALV